MHEIASCVADVVNRVGDQAHVMSYSMAGGKMWNLIITVPEVKEPGLWASEENYDVAKMRSFFKGWGPAHGFASGSY